MKWQAGRERSGRFAVSLMPKHQLQVPACYGIPAFTGLTFTLPFGCSAHAEPFSIRCCACVGMGHLLVFVPCWGIFCSRLRRG